MPCFRPLSGYRSKVLNPSGKRSIVFSKNEALSTEFDDAQILPCGQCTYCRLEHSRNFAIRCTHEASLYPENCFLTLTYDSASLPEHSFLDYQAPVKFMHDLRQKYGSGIRSYGCAEYGGLFQRPHYHLCIFNFNFSDKKLWSKNDDNPLFTSDSLSSLWPHGHTLIGDLTFESAAYVARYVTKKITGPKSLSHYEHISPTSGEIFQRPPERSIAVSRMPGIGRTWFEQNYQFLLDHDFVVSRGKKVRPPKYYDRLLEKRFPKEFDEIKKNRRKNGEIISEKLLAEDHEAMLNYSKKHDAWEHDVPLPKRRLYVMEEVQQHKIKLLKRSLENG